MTKKTKAVAKPYERSEAEVAFMKNFQNRKDAKPTVPKSTGTRPLCVDGSNGGFLGYWEYW